MERSAIEAIQQSTAVTCVNDRIKDHTLALPVVAMPDSVKTFDLEKYLPSRARFRGQFSTKTVTSFGDYAEKNSDTTHRQAVFIDAEDMKARLVLNLGNNVRAGHCDHTASLQLEKTAAYTALLGVVGSQLNQREAAEFIEDWRTSLSAWSEEDDNGEKQSIPLVKALHAIRSLTIEATAKHDSDVRNMGETTSSMASIDAKSTHQIPAQLKFSCEPYHGLASRTFDLRVSIITQAKPQIVLRIIRTQEHQEEMAKQFQELITKELNEKSPDVESYIGTFAA
jgi:uncharacterized protein YfdQ (DUF2303 family)